MAEANPQPNTPTVAEDLASIAARAQTYTGASGSAIALSEGDISSMTCRASSGPAAPDIGAHIGLEGTFTGMAVQSGQALRCDDSETDNRVDAAACRALGTRSIVVVPIRDADTEAVIGVLAVFCGTKNAFNDLHVAVLRTMAREVAVSVQKAKKAGISVSTMTMAAYVDPPAGQRPPSNPGFRPPIPTTPAPPRPSTGTITSAAAAAPKPAPTSPPQPVAVAPTIVTPAPKLAPPVPPPPAAPKAGPAPLAENVSSSPAPIPISPRRAAASTPATTPEWKPATPPPARKFEAETPRSEAARPVTFGTFDSVAQDKKPGGGGMGIWIGVAAAAVLIVGGYFGYAHFASKPSEPAAAPVSTQAQAQSTPVPTTTPTPAATSSAPASTPAAPQPTATATQPAAKPVTPPQTQSQPQAQPKPATPPPSKPSPQAVERAAVTPNATRQEAPQPLPAAATAIAVPIATSAPTLASPPPKVSQSTAAQVVSQVSPKYPEMAKTMHAGGDVVVEAVVGKDGSVKTAKATSGNVLLRDAATSAVKQWKYKPATLDGQPVETTVQITVKFGAPR
jgi:TonB family protein